MKRLTAFICLIMSILFVYPAEAKTSDIIGKVYNTDIVVYMNNYAIPSYAVNGTSCIVAEDLRNFGCDVVWDGDARQLNISRNTDNMPIEMKVEKTGAAGTVFANLLETDIAVYAGGTKIPSYAINGYTMIPAEGLTMFAEVNWVADQRALKLWIDGLHIRDGMQPVTQYTPPTTASSGTISSTNTSQPISGSYIGNANTGRFHRSTCSSVKRMKDSNKVYLSSRDEAINKGYVPCKNCNP